MTIICEPDAERASALIAALHHPAHVVPTLADAAKALVVDTRESLLIIGADVELDGALSLTARLRTDRPGLGVILLRDDLDVAVLTRAMRAGVRDVLAADARDELVQAARRSHELTAQAFAAPAPANAPPS